MKSSAFELNDVVDGYLTMPSRPGIGFEAQNALYAVMQDLAA